jgi:hypothetical protein
MLAGALLACGVQALAFLLTGNVLAPVVAHMALHVEMLGRGVELPPVGRRAAPVTIDEHTGHDGMIHEPDLPAGVTAALAGSQGARRRVRG